MKRIEENWKSIEGIEERARKKTSDPLAGFNADLFSFGERYLILPILYRTKRKDGTFTKTMKKLNIVANFCPFTGLPLYEDEK